MAQAKHAKVTLNGCLSLSVGTLRLVQHKPVVVTDPKLIEQLKGQSGVSVEEFSPAPAKQAAPVKQPEQKASEDANETEVAKAQLAARRNNKQRPAGPAEAKG
jgi:hypothetical protein